MAEARRKKEAGLTDEAIRNYSILLLMARTDHNNADAAECLMSLGALFWEEGKIDKSAKHFAEALNIAQTNHWAALSQFCKGALDIHALYKSGKTFRDQMDIDSSERCFLQAIDISRRIKSAGHEAKCLRQLSIVRYYRMDWDGFYRANKRAYDLSDRNNFPREKSHSAFNIAYFYLKTGRYHDAYVLFDEARDLYLRLGAEEDVAECDHNIALIHYEMGDFDRSLRELGKIALRTRDEGLKTAVLISMGNAAKKLALLKNNRRGLYEAASYYRKALDLAIRRQDGFAETAALNNLGYFYYELGKLPLALKYFLWGSDVGRRIPNTDLKCTVMANTANVYLKMNEYALAEAHYKKAIRRLRPGEPQTILWEAFFGLGRCHEQKGRWDLALSFYLRAVDMLEELAADIRAEQDMDRYLFNKYEVYEGTIRLLFDSYRARPDNHEEGKAIVSIIDRLKSKTLLDFLMDQHDARPAALPAAVGGESDDDMESAGFSVDDASELMGGNSALLMYYVGDAVSLLALVTADGIQCFPLPPRDKLEKTVGHYLKLLTGPDLSEFQGRSAAHGLFCTLFAPGSERFLSGVKNLVVIPDGILNRLPFETLVMDAAADGEPAYLMERYSISYAPSLSSLTFLRRLGAAGAGPGKVLMIGKSDYQEHAGAEGDGYLLSLQKAAAESGFTFPPLPGVLKEIRGISSSTKRGRFAIRINDEADEGFLKQSPLSSYCIIHFACHGLIDETNPLRSSLILTRKRESREDGHLQVREISDLRLKADLVVLSACQTGRGKLSRGEGVMGLVKAFFYAGAKSVLSTLWNVNDETTAVFMRNFYSHLTRGMAKNEALKRAKLEMIKSGFSHPYYWAPFVLSGDYESPCRLN